MTPGAGQMIARCYVCGIEWTLQPRAIGVRYIVPAQGITTHSILKSCPHCTLVPQQLPAKFVVKLEPDDDDGLPQPSLKT